MKINKILFFSFKNKFFNNSEKSMDFEDSLKTFFYLEKSSKFLIFLKNGEIYEIGENMENL